MYEKPEVLRLEKSFHNVVHELNAQVLLLITQKLAADALSMLEGSLQSHDQKL